jgi:hypothetical protein
MHLFADESVGDEELKCIKYNGQPWTEVSQKWHAAAAYRIQMYFEGKRISQIPSICLILKSGKC